MHVPENACEILDEVLKQATKVFNLNVAINMTPDAPEDWVLLDLPRESSKLTTMLEVLALKWCGADPLTYRWSVTEDESLWTLSYWPQESNLKSDSARVAIPSELGEALKFVTDTEFCSHVGSTAGRISELLTSLQYRIQVRGRVGDSEEIRTVDQAEAGSIRIPEDAKVLIGEMREEANALSGSLKELLEMTSDSATYVDQYAKASLALKLFLSHANMFPYKWAKMNPFNCNVFGDVHAGVYYFHFFDGRHPTEIDPLVRDPVAAPQELGYVFENLPTDSDLVAHPDDISKLIKYINETVHLLSVLLEKLQFRDEIAQERQSLSIAPENVPQRDSISATIPEDANSILDEIISQCDKIIALEGTPEALSDPLGHTFESEQEIESFFELLNLVGHKWCGVDPLEYDYCSWAEGEKYYLIFYRQTTKLSPGTGLEVRNLPSWHRDGPVPKDAIRKPVPAELGIAINKYENGHYAWPTAMTEFVRDSLMSLRNKLMARPGIDVEPNCTDLEPNPNVTVRSVSNETEVSGGNDLAEKSAKLVEFVAGDDYRSVRIRGEEFSLTYKESLVVRLLHEHYLQGTPDVGFHRLAEEATGGIVSSHKSLRDIFRNAEARQKLIRQGDTKGTYRLNL